MRTMSLVCLLGTSNKARTRRLLTFRTKMTARELGAQTGSSPATRVVTAPRRLPSIGETQIWNPAEVGVVKTIYLPSGDQSGSVGLAALSGMRLMAPPLAEMV